MYHIVILILLLSVSAFSNDWVENNGKREWAHAKRTMVKVSHELEMISWPGLPDSTYFKVDVGSITDSIWYIGDTTYIGIDEFYHARFYNIGDNNIEWDAVLYQQPGNQFSWEFPIEHNNLVFYYQGELSQELIDEGWERPDSVIGSYAVYHSYKGGNLIPVADAAYKVGKAFHVFRPRAWDSADSTVWLDMEIDTIANTVTISGTRAWFRDAVYPVIIDPQFGYTTQGTGGGSLACCNDKVRHMAKATTAPSGATGAVIDSVTYSVHTLTSGPHGVIWGLYEDESGNPGDSVCTQSSGEEINATGWTKTTVGFGTNTLTNSTIYYITTLNDCNVSTRIKLHYDDTPGTVWTRYNSDIDYRDYPDLPGGWVGASGSGEYRVSIYATYSIHAAGDAYGGQVINVGGN